jgi:hypothetical protein
MKDRGTTDEQKVVSGENGPFSFARRSPKYFLRARHSVHIGGQLREACLPQQTRKIHRFRPEIFL